MGVPIANIMQSFCKITMDFFCQTPFIRNKRKTFPEITCMGSGSSNNHDDLGGDRRKELASSLGLFSFNLPLLKKVL